MRKIFILYLLAVGYINGQNGSFFKTEVEISGMAGISIDKTIVEIVSKGNYYKVTTEIGNNKTITSSKSDKVSLYSQEGTNSPDCAEGTPKEYQEASKKRSGKVPVFKDVEVKKTNKTETILGYKCMNAIIKYKTEMSPGFVFTTEESVWYTEEIKIESSEITSELNGGVANDYTNALAKLGGFILKKESKGPGGGKTTSTVTEFELRDVTDDELNIDIKCKKTLTIEAYYKLIEEREEARRRSEMQNNQMYKGY